MYAIVKTGGKQYKVAVDDVVTVEKVVGEPGDEISLDHGARTARRAGPEGRGTAPSGAQAGRRVTDTPRVKPTERRLARSNRPQLLR